MGELFIDNWSSRVSAELRMKKVSQPQGLDLEIYQFFVNKETGNVSIMKGRLYKVENVFRRKCCHFKNIHRKILRFIQ